MTASLPQLLAASALVVKCEKLCSAGLLPEQDEQTLRYLLTKVCRAFEIPTLAERPANSNADLNQQLSLVAQEMERGDSL
jgi:hypothetical protein